MKPARNKVGKRTFTPAPLCRFCGATEGLVVSRGVRKAAARCQDVDGCRERTINRDRAVSGSFASRPAFSAGTKGWGER